MHADTYTGTANIISNLTPETLVNGVHPVKFSERYDTRMILKRIAANAKKIFPRYS